MSDNTKLLNTPLKELGLDSQSVGHLSRVKLKVADIGEFEGIITLGDLLNFYEKLQISPGTPKEHHPLNRCKGFGEGTISRVDAIADKYRHLANLPRTYEEVCKALELLSREIVAGTVSDKAKQEAKGWVDHFNQRNEAQQRTNRR